MQILVCLAQRPGHVVTRSELIDTIWADLYTGDDALNLSISRLRKALGDDPKQPRIIETIPKSGYRLIAPVIHLSAVPEATAEPILLDESTPSRPRKRRKKWLWWGPGSLAFVGLLVFVLNASVAEQNVIPDPSFSLPKPLTSYAGRERHGTLSPDGQKLAFTWQGSSRDNWDIYVKMIGTETPLRLTDHPHADLKPVWAPDEQHLAFLRYTEGHCAIYLVDILGGAERKLTDCGSNAQADLAWSSDGAWITYSDRESPGAPYSIYLYALGTRERQKLTQPSVGLLGDHSPVFSPDNKAVAFTRTREEGVADIYQVSLEERTSVRVTFLNRGVSGLTWTANGERLIFSSDRDGFFNLWGVSARGGLATRVTAPTHATLLDPALSPADNTLLYEQWSYDTNIWRIDPAEPARAAPLITSSQPDFAPQFSPTGDRLAFVSRRSGNTEVWLCDADGTNLIQLTFLENPLVSTPRWSPDGARIVFVARPEGQTDFYRPLEPSDLYMVDAVSGTVERLTDTPNDVRAPAWSADGEWIYYADLDAKRWQIRKVSVEKQESVHVKLDGALHVAESPDGSTFYYTKFGKPGLWYRPVSGGAEAVLFVASGFGGFDPWAVMHEGIYFMRRGEKKAELALFRFYTQQVESIVALPKQEISPSFAVAPNGGSVLLVREHQSESDLMQISLAGSSSSD